MKLNLYVIRTLSHDEYSSEDYTYVILARDVDDAKATLRGSELYGCSWDIDDLKLLGEGVTGTGLPENSAVIY